MTYWIIIWLVVCPITGQEVREETKTYNTPSWKNSNLMELPNHLVAVGRPIKITEYWEEYKANEDGITMRTILHEKEWEKP